MGGDVLGCDLSHLLVTTGTPQQEGGVLGWTYFAFDYAVHA